MPFFQNFMLAGLHDFYEFFDILKHFLTEPDHLAFIILIASIAFILFKKHFGSAS